jgi:hypothetical protein
LMRGRRVISRVLCHCVRSLFLFCMGTRVEVAMCTDLKVPLFRGLYWGRL